MVNMVLLLSQFFSDSQGCCVQTIAIQPGKNQRQEMDGANVYVLGQPLSAICGRSWLHSGPTGSKMFI